MTTALSILIYVLTFLCSSLFFHYSLKTSRKIKRFILLFVAILIPSLTAMFRTSGADLKTYLSYFDQIKQLGFNSGREFLWVLLNLISPTKRIMLLLSAFTFLFFSCCCILNFLKKDQTFAWAILMLVFYSTFLNIMRQMIAISIIFCGFKYLFNKKYLQYLFTVLIGCLFHSSSIFMIGMPIVLFFVKRIKRFDIWMLAAMFIGPLLLPLIFDFFNLIGLFTKYAHIGDIKIEPQFILCMLPPVFMYYFTGGRKRHSQTTNLLFGIYLVCFPIQTMGFLAQYIDRLTYNFYFTLILLMPMIISEIKDGRQRYLARNIMYVWFIVYYIGVFVVAGTASVYPYIQFSIGGFA